MVIYKITNILNKKVYIGSTVCFSKRKAEHLKDLSDGLHHNYRLQNDFNSLGADFFLFEIIETGIRKKQDLLFKEYELIARLKSTDYNIDRVLPLSKIDKKLKGDRVKISNSGTYIFVDKKVKPKRYKKQIPQKEINKQGKRYRNEGNSFKSKK